jgi:hypothetical protein
MAWIKLDDGFPNHPKVVRAGEDAAWLFVSGLCYCGAQLTDGFIPAGMVQRLTAKKAPERLASRLVEVGLWTAVADGFQVHDYLDWNPPGEEVKEKREATRERVKNWRTKRRCNSVTPPFGNADVTISERGGNADVTPLPYPSPSEVKSSLPPAGARSGGTGPAAPAHSPQPPEATKTRPWTAADFEAVFVAVCRTPTGGDVFGQNSVIAGAKLVRDLAAIEAPIAPDPKTLAPELLASYREMIADWTNRGEHGGQLSTVGFVEKFQHVVAWWRGVRPGVKARTSGPPLLAVRVVPDEEETRRQQEARRPAKPCAPPPGFADMPFEDAK